MYFQFPFTHVLYYIYLSMFFMLPGDGNILTLWSKNCLSHYLTLVV